MKKGEEEGGISVKISGPTVATTLAIKHKLERERGVGISFVEVVREAIEVMAKAESIEPRYFREKEGET